MAVTPPLLLVTRAGNHMGFLLMIPVYSPDKLLPRAGLRQVLSSENPVNMAENDAPAIYYGVNRIADPQAIVQQHAHSSNDSCGEVYRAVCAPFGTPEEVMLAYNESVAAVERGEREFPLQPCSSRCVRGQLMRGYALGVFFFSAISQEAQVVRDPDAPLAIYSEDVTELVLDARKRLTEPDGQLSGARETPYDKYAYLSIEEGLKMLKGENAYDLLAAGADAIPTHLIEPGLGAFQFAINEVESQELRDNSDTPEAGERILKLFRT